MEVVVLEGKTSAEKLLNIFTANILERGSEAAANTSDTEGEYKDDPG